MLNSRMWFKEAVKTISEESIQSAQSHQSVLTKPPGSLGKLEELAERFAGWQATKHPKLNSIGVRVFAGDHGVCAQGVSAFPQEVTAQMVLNFLHGGAAISVLSEQIGADFTVVNMGTVAPVPVEGRQFERRFIAENIAPGTKDFTKEPAMTEKEVLLALEAGRKQVQGKHYDLFIGGEMGIGNTTSASALYCVLLDLKPEDAVGPGTGVDSDGIQRKQCVIQEAFSVHAINNPLDALRILGGLEIAALVGSYIACAQEGIPVLVDGFICTAAALVAIKLNEDVKNWMLFAHKSAEPAHQQALEKLQVQPILDLSMRLGEGSGAAVAVPILQSAINLHNCMATFDQAGVSDK